MKSQSQSRSRIHRRLPEERGWTLIELLVGIIVTLGVLLAAFPIIDGASNTEGRVQQAALSVGDARVFSDQILRDLRPAYFVEPFYSSTRLAVDTYIRTTACGSGIPSPSDQAPIKCRVTYSCSVDSCTRQETNPDGSGGGPIDTAVSGLSNDQVFSYVAAGDTPEFVGITLVLPNQQNVGGDAITLEDGTALRNVGTV
jgi:type II secretory pathway pseudopilin PulG